MVMIIDLAQKPALTGILFFNIVPAIGIIRKNILFCLK